MSFTIPPYVHTFDKISDCRKLMVNARKEKREDIYWAAFRRLCTLEGMNYDDPLHQGFYEMLAAYEQLLTEKNKRTTKATRTRQKLLRVGVEKCLEDWSLDSDMTQGFSMLMANKLSDLTAEYLVLKFASRFPETVVEAAHNRIEDEKRRLAA